MRSWPRMVLGTLLLVIPVACTEAPQFMKDDEKSGAVIFAGQFAQGSMFRDNDAPESAYAPTAVAAQPAPMAAHPAPVLPGRSLPRPAPLRTPSTVITMPSPI